MEGYLGSGMTEFRTERDRMCGVWERLGGGGGEER